MNSRMKDLRMESIVELASVLTQQSDYQEILRLITARASETLKAGTVLVMMVNPRTRRTIKTIFRDSSKDDEKAFRLIHTYFSGWIIDHNTGFFSEDIQNDSRFRNELLKNSGIKSAICVPLRVEGLIIGTILVFSNDEKVVYNRDDHCFLENFTSVVSPFLRNVEKVEDYFNKAVPEETLLNKYRVSGLFGRSRTFKELLRSVDAAAACDARVLLQGSSGTGKELIARAIHNLSSRNDRGFIALDCGAIPEALIESELFGHSKGAFTGSVSDRKGLFEEANNGTLFLDEISNLPVALQAKLLRVLQEGEIRPLGSNKTRKINVRIISASSVPLKEMVDQHKFREDLFYRLMVYPIDIPSLEERKDDIPLLACHFLSRFAREQHKKAERFHEEIIEFMKFHPWTGNIRELENFVERMVTLMPMNRKLIDKSVLPREFMSELKKIDKRKKGPGSTTILSEVIAGHEMELIRKALIDHSWNQTMAAKQLGIHESTLRYKIAKYGIRKVTMP